MRNIAGVGMNIDGPQDVVTKENLSRLLFFNKDLCKGQVVQAVRSNKGECGNLASVFATAEYQRHRSSNALVPGDTILREEIHFVSVLLIIMN